MYFDDFIYWQFFLHLHVLIYLISIFFISKHYVFMLSIVSRYFQLIWFRQSFHLKDFFSLFSFVLVEIFLLGTFSKFHPNHFGFNFEGSNSAPQLITNISKLHTMRWGMYSTSSSTNICRSYSGMERTQVMIE